MRTSVGDPSLTIDISSHLPIFQARRIEWLERSRNKAAHDLAFLICLGHMVIITSRTAAYPVQIILLSVYIYIY